jgi:hypothetical protein
VTDLRPFILLAIALLLPLSLLVSGRHRFLLGWIGFTLFVHLFDTILIMNLAAIRLAGLVLLPYALLTIGWWSRITAAKAWLLNFAYLIVLGIVFGFLWPWADITGNRPFTFTAQGRTIVYLVRSLADLSLTVFVAQQVRKPGAILYLSRAMVVGAATTAAAGIAYYVTRVDFYYAITGILRDYSVDRPRGFSYEPRGLALACVYGAIILLIGQDRIFRRWLVLLCVILGAFVLAYSASALAVLAALLAFSWLYFSWKVRWSIVVAAAIIAILIALAAYFTPDEYERASLALRQRWELSLRTPEDPRNMGETIGYHLDIFDASAFLFLWRHPVYAITGTGPGLITLPASYHVPPGLYSILWPPEKGINSPPSHGLLLEVANSGIIGLTLWVIQVVACWKSLKLMAPRHMSERILDEWSLAKALFLVGVIGYAIQSSVVPVWSVFLGLGWAASLSIAAARKTALSTRRRG